MINESYPTPEEIMVVVAPCTENILDCEVMRAAIRLRATAEDELNEVAKDIRTELAKYACQHCYTYYLSDIETDITLKDRPLAEGF